MDSRCGAGLEYWHMGRGRMEKWPAHVFAPAGVGRRDGRR